MILHKNYSFNINATHIIDLTMGGSPAVRGNFPPEAGQVVPVYREAIIPLKLIII